MERVGPFVFGDLIGIFCNKYKLKLIPEEFDEDVGWEVYRREDEFSIYSKMGRIEAVSCLTNCNFNDINLIGVSIEKVLNFLKVHHDMVETIELSEGPQEVYDFDNLGLQLWVKDDVVVTAICNGPCEDDEE